MARSPGGPTGCTAPGRLSQVLLRVEESVSTAGGLSGRTALVTGGARGIGRDLVRGLAAAGARVGVLDIRADQGEALAAEFGSSCVRFRQCDVADPAAIEAAFAWGDDWLGRLDTLICCAGLDKPGFAAEDIPLEAWDLLFDVNARGTFLANQQACRRMKAQTADPGGSIINFASYAGYRGMPDRAAYSAAKGAILGWTRAAARAWGAYDITVNAIAPTMNTDVAQRYLASLEPEVRARMDEERRAATPLGGRLGEVEDDLLPLILLLTGPGGRYMTGQTFAVDGGRTMVGS